MLDVQNVVKDFDGLRAVDGASLQVPKGAIVGLIGPNGSGKSTLLSLIARTMDVTAGRITLDGQDITHLSSDKVFRMGLARGFQDPSLFFQMTVLDNALLPVKEQRGERPWYAPWRRSWKGEEQSNARKADEVLEQVKLKTHANHATADLSGGQMKLLEIGRCLMGEPKLMLLDEPTAGVAPKLAYDIFQHIDTLRHESGITFLIVEHRLEILFDFVDLVYVMHMGKVLAQGTPEEIGKNATVREVYFGE